MAPNGTMGSASGMLAARAMSQASQPALVEMALGLEKSLDELASLVSQAEAGVQRLKAEPSGDNHATGNSPIAPPPMSLENRLSRLQQVLNGTCARLAAVVHRLDSAV